MSSTANLIAFDLGAESGRAVVGQLDGDKLTLEYYDDEKMGTFTK